MDKKILSKINGVATAVSELQKLIVAESELPGNMPLADLSAEQFARVLVCVIDETLNRFRQSDRLPWAANENLFDDLLRPLVQGRALKLCNGVYERAGRMFQKAGLERGKPEHKRNLELYASLIAAVDNGQKVFVSPPPNLDVGG